MFSPTRSGRDGRSRSIFLLSRRNCGKLPFWTMMELLLKSVKRSTSSMLDEFFSDLRKKMGNPISQTIHCSQQAFSKARAGISHTIFQECFENVLDFLCSTESLNYHRRLGGIWGIQPIAIDGSKIPLPNRKALLHKYGSIGRGASSPTAMASIAYDVLNHRILDALLEPMSVDERTLAARHIDHIRCKSRTVLLCTMFIFDRGYASKKLISYIENEIHARNLFRLRSKFNLEIDAGPDQFQRLFRELHPAGILDFCTPCQSCDADQNRNRRHH